MPRWCWGDARLVLRTLLDEGGTNERRDDQRERLRELGPGSRAGGQRGPQCDDRRFVEALLWMASSGGPWLPWPTSPAWNSC